MIESSALFWSTSYLSLALDYLSSRRKLTLAIASLAGCMAGLAKVTTFAVALVPIVLAFGATWLKWQRAVSDKRGGLALSLLGLVVVPLIGVLAWTWYADALKAQNYLGQFLTARALADWNWGSLEQRFSANTWMQQIQRGDLIIGHAAILGLVLISFSLPHRGAAWLALGLFLCGPLLFCNLHFVHEYYSFANGIYLIGAVGISIVAMLERGGAWGKAGSYVCYLVLALSFVRYFVHYFPIQLHDDRHLIEITQKLQGMTAPGDTVMILGCDWSSEIPYYSHRRALMVPRWTPEKVGTLSTLLEHYPTCRPGALLIRRADSLSFSKQEIEALAARLGLASPPMKIGENFDLYVSETAKMAAQKTSRMGSTAGMD
jgi:hypothetical protein